MTQQPSLCMPDKEKSCFACCPPIRPAGYEHVQYKNIIKRILIENTLSFRLQKKPITGFSCWALGYIDKDFKRVGCLLHPEHIGVDLRYLTGYGEKCRREICLEAKIFLNLEYDTKIFWLQLADGLDSFSYSSRKINPLFRILRWGKEILEHIAERECWRVGVDYKYIKTKYPFINTHIDPRAITYPLKIMIRSRDAKAIMPNEIKKFLKEMESIIHSLLTLKNDFDARYTHILNMDKDFLDFLRLGLSIKKISLANAIEIKEKVDMIISKMCISSNI